MRVQVLEDTLQHCYILEGLGETKVTKEKRLHEVQRDSQGTRVGGEEGKAIREGIEEEASGWEGGHRVAHRSLRGCHVKEVSFCCIEEGWTQPDNDCRKLTLRQGT